LDAAVGVHPPVMSTPDSSDRDTHEPPAAVEDDEVSRLQDELDVANDCGPADGTEPPGTPPQ
jgi:hypothetical protein